MEKYILDAGLAAVIDAGLGDRLLASIMERLDRIPEGGHRGTLIQHLLTMKLRLHDNLRGALAALVEAARVQSGSPSLPAWYIGWPMMAAGRGTALMHRCARRGLAVARRG